MNLIVFVYIAAGLWFLQQVNDNLQAYLNRESVPKLYWLSAAASFLSGVALFYFLTEFFDTMGSMILFLLMR